MELMGQANFQSVFIGIESPNEDALKETKKLQNVRPKAGTILDRVHRIQEHGLDVWCGMIVGFDSDDPSSFGVMPGFLSDARIANALIGLLHAIPTTPLHKRLASEGRLNDIDASDEYGTNVVPLNMTPAELRDGFAAIMREVYTPEAYFARVDGLFLRDGFKFAAHQLPYWRTNRWAWTKRAAGNYVKFAVLASRLMSSVEDPALRKRYRRQLAAVATARPWEPHILFIYAIKMAMHYHYDEIVRSMVGTDGVSNAGRSFSRSRRASPVAAKPEAPLQAAE